MSNVIIIGGGASGLMAGVSALKKGNRVKIIEKNDKIGKKLYITGKGRCNLTNYCDNEEFLSNIVRNSKFVFSAINNFNTKDTFNFFEQNGLKLKVERGNRVFPESDKASDVTKTLEKFLISNGAEIILNQTVLEIIVKDNKVVGVKTDKGEIICDSVILCSGGATYSFTGSNGDGYRLVKPLGHNIIDVKPSLVGLCFKGGDYCDLQGLSLKNVSISFIDNGKMLYNEFGEMLFTHFGASGPIVLSCSSVVNRSNFENSKLIIDLKPALTPSQLDVRFIREFSTNSNKEIATVMHELVPKALIPLLLSRATVRASKKCCEITKEERGKLVKILKELPFDVKGLRPLEEAIVTSGGIDVKQINPKTMESKIIKGLFFAGEVIDVDAFTGGFNLQLAFSTGYLAGKSS